MWRNILKNTWAFVNKTIKIIYTKENKMYTAWEKVRELNSKKFGINSPVQPELF